MPQQPRSSSKPNARFYRPELDVLRFVAFRACSFTMPYRILRRPMGLKRIAATVRSWGYGIDLFLLLSSFLITELLLRELESRGRLDIWWFYMRRTLRIWPLYFGFLALTLLVVPLVLPRENVPFSHMLGFLTFTGNWTTAILGWPRSVIAPLWSICLEEQFYLAWPLLIALVGRHRNSKTLRVFDRGGMPCLACDHERPSPRNVDKHVNAPRSNCPGGSYQQ